MNPRDAQEQVRPVFLYADEAQFFINKHDALFQTTARSSRASTVYLTQNLPNYQMALGGSGGHSAAVAFLGNLQTKIFHANGDPDTNQFGSNSIGRTRQIQLQGGQTDTTGQNRGGSQNSGASLVFEHLVQSHEFTILRTGGADNDCLVDSIIFQSGRRWNVIENGKSVTRNFLRYSFKQPERK